MEHGGTAQALCVVHGNAVTTGALSAAHAGRLAYYYDLPRRRFPCRTPPQDDLIFNGLLGATNWRVYLDKRFKAKVEVTIASIALESPVFTKGKGAGHMAGGWR